MHRGACTEGAGLLATPEISLVLLQHEIPSNLQMHLICNILHLDIFCFALASRRAACQTHWPRSATTWPPTAASARALCMTASPRLLSSRAPLSTPLWTPPTSAYTPTKRCGCSPQVWCPTSNQYAAGYGTRPPLLDVIQSV